MALCFGHFVVAVLLPAGVHLCVRKPGLGVDVERRERIGNRRGRRCQGAWRVAGFEGAGSASDLFEVVAIVDILTVNHKDRLYFATTRHLFVCNIQYKAPEVLG